MTCIPVITILESIVVILFAMVVYGVFLNFLKHKEKIVLFLRMKIIQVMYLWRRVTLFFKNNRHSLRRLSYLILALIIAFLVTKFSGEGFTQEVLSNYLVAVGAMTGGTIAIVFTISLFLLQNAGNLYSSQFLEVYIYDWRERVVYFLVILITLLILGGGLYTGGLETGGGSIPTKITDPIVWLSLFLIGVVFALIDWQYKNVRQKMSPTEAITFLEKEGKKFLSRLNREAKKVVKVVKIVNPTLSDSDALKVAFNRIFDENYLDRQLENLVEISNKLAERGEIQSTKRCYTAIYNILSDFLDSKKSTSFASPATGAFLAMQSDSQSLLNKSFERINKTGERFLQQGMEGTASYIVDIIYGALAKRARVITFTQIGAENPILSQIAFYLNFYAEIGEKAKNIEVAFQASRVLGEVGMIAAEEGHRMIVFGIQDNLFQRAQFGITEKQMIIVDKCVEGLVGIIRATFVNPRNVSSYESDRLLKKLTNLTLLINGLVKAGYLPDEYSTQVSLSNIFDNLYSALVDIANHYFTLTDEQQKKNYRSDVVSLAKDLVMVMRQFSEQVNDGDSFVMNSVGRFIYHTNQMFITLIKEDSDFAESEIERWLRWNLNLPFWFAHHAEKIKAGELPFKELTDSVAKTGILIYENLDDKELVKESIECIYAIAKEALEKADVGYGFDEPRIMEKACYLGILALKKGWHDVVFHISTKIWDFESKQATKYPREKDRLYEEVSQWRSEFDYQKLNGVHSLMDSAQDMMYPLIEKADIDRFIFNVWGIIEDNCSIEAELLGRKKE